VLSDAISKCFAAAQGGHLEVLQRARELGCLWDERVSFIAASFGHLHVLQWLRANGCPWNPHIHDVAAKQGHDDVLQWAIANGCHPLDPEVLNLLNVIDVDYTAEDLHLISGPELLEAVWYIRFGAPDFGTLVHAPV
jgi:hypothetical protein